MFSPASLLTAAHLVGLAWAMGAATVKLALLLKTRTDPTFLDSFLRVARLITRQIILGMVLLTLSGIGWLLLGYPLTPRLVIKLVLVAAIWGMGPVIDKVIEPRYRQLRPAAEVAPSPGFLRVQRQYLFVETTATLLFYVIVAIWVFG